jgi:hypothetical protein
LKKVLKGVKWGVVCVEFVFDMAMAKGIIPYQANFTYVSTDNEVY